MIYKKSNIKGQNKKLKSALSRFFPNFLKNIAYILPFRYIVDVPFRIYSGNISTNSAINPLLLGVVWLIIIVIFGYILSLKAIKKAIIQGG